MFVRHLLNLEADDVALGKPATSSSIYYWITGNGLAYSNASFAVNGQNNHQKIFDNQNSGPNGYFPRVCSATAQSSEVPCPLTWWSVDFGDIYIIQSVTVYGFPLSDNNRK